MQIKHLPQGALYCMFESVLDFDYLVISNQLFDPHSVKSTLDFFSALGIKKFIFTYEVDFSAYSISRIHSSIRALRKQLNQLRPRGVKIYLCPEIFLTKDAVKNPSIPLLSVEASEMIFVRLDWFFAQDWLEENLNYLIFKQKLKPIFISFENNICTTSKDIIHRLLQSHGLSFGLDVNYITSISSRKIIQNMINSERIIYPVLSHDITHYPGIFKAMLLFKEKIGIEQYTKFCRSLHYNGQNLLRGL